MLAYMETLFSRSKKLAKKLAKKIANSYFNLLANDVKNTFKVHVATLMYG